MAQQSASKIHQKSCWPSRKIPESVEPGAFLNPTQHPNVIVLSDATYSIVGTEGFDSFDAMLTRIQNVLIIELKKGNSSIGRNEMTQADGYVQDFLQSGAMDGTPLIRAFVVGHQISPRTPKRSLFQKWGLFAEQSWPRRTAN